MPVTVFLRRTDPRECGAIDLCDRISAIVHGPWEFRGLKRDFWLLIRYYRSGVIDHPLGETAGHEGGKGLLPWYDRDHEVIGIGIDPTDAASAILRGGRGARLRGIRRAGEDLQMHLLFKDLDSGRVFYPDDALRLRGGAS